MQEIWKDVSGYYGFYQVSNMGRVRSVDRYVDMKDGRVKFIKGQDMKLFLDNRGYCRVPLSKNNKLRFLGVHRIVLLAFVPNVMEYPQVNHKNGIKNDNRVDNLEWCTASHNQKHAYDAGLKVSSYMGMCGVLHHRSKPAIQIDFDGNVIRHYESVNMAAIDTGIGAGSIWNCCNGKRKLAGGYKWMYKKDYEKKFGS